MEPAFLPKFENPIYKSNILSKTFFCWITDTFKQVFKHGLEIKDLYKLEKEDESEYLSNLLEQNWNLELARLKYNKQPSLLRALNKTFFWNMMFYAIPLFGWFILARCCQPIILSYFLYLIATQKDFLPQKILMAALLTLCSFLTAVLRTPKLYGQARIGMKMRIAISSLIYRHMLKLDTKSLQKISAGDILNLLSSDVSRFDYSLIYVHYLWMTILQIAIICIILWEQTTTITLFGALTLIFILFLCQFLLLIGKMIRVVQPKYVTTTDSRIKFISTLINSIQVIKMYVWEKSFENIIEKIRKREVKFLRYLLLLKALYLVILVMFDKLLVFFTITCNILQETKITPEYIYSLIRYFSILQVSVGYLLFLCVSYGAETLVGIKRLEEFLLMQTKVTPTVQQINTGNILLKHVTASWGDKNTVLQEVDIEITNNQLCTVIGPVGAGKTSFLQLLLGELYVKNGKLSIGGSISYASQEPWIFSSSIRNNILFGLNYDQARYEKVLSVCALDKDLENFVDGDKTIVGERGATLSGGQRVRLNLARAIYRDTDIYLLDDPLSAIDNRVKRHIFEKTILEFLKDKTVILVTHQLQYLEKADIIILLNEGKIVDQGCYQHIIQKNKNLLQSFNEAEEENNDQNLVTQSLPIDSLIPNTNEEQKLEVSDKKHEEEITSSIGANPLVNYMKAFGSYFNIISVLVVLLIPQVFITATDYTMAITIRHYSKPFLEFQLKNSTVNDSDKFVYEVNKSSTKSHILLYIYLGLLLLSLLLTAFRSVYFFNLTIIASKNLYNKMFDAVINAPVAFFHKNPTGRVVNRFSKEMNLVEEWLPKALMEFLQVALIILGVVVTIIVVNYYTVVIISILGLILWKLVFWYIVIFFKIRHLETITKSNVFTHVNTSFHGIVTIRALGNNKILEEQFDLHQDVHTSVWNLMISCRAAFCLWIDFIGIALEFSVIMMCIFFKYDPQYISFVGLSLVQSMVVIGLLQYCTWLFVESINHMGSVERLVQYAQIEKEEQGCFKEEYHSSEGECSSIIFKNVILRYNESGEPVLKNINLNIESGMKIGIVGKTGSGKSSLINALFRLTPFEGQILIDNIDTKTIPLKQLRKQISILPQEPILFSDTLRYNLDPFKKYDDHTLWNILEEVNMKEVINSLDMMVSEGGNNFSVGQKQLLCLARMMLQKNRILILDEATANIDSQTEFIIQDTLKKKFKYNTIITVAHRLNTIMDSDKILVMHLGKVVEYDHPSNLLRNVNGLFYKMIMGKHA